MSSVFSNRPYGCNPRRRATCSSQQKLGTKMDISKRTNKIRPSMLAECIWRSPVAAFAAVSGHGAERVAGLIE